MKHFAIILLLLTAQGCALLGAPAAVSAVGGAAGTGSFFLNKHDHENYVELIKKLQKRIEWLEMANAERD